MSEHLTAEASGVEDSDLEALRVRAGIALQQLAGAHSAAALPQARALVLALRNVRDYDTLGRLTEAVSRVDPADARNRRFYAQCLIDTGHATAAIDMLEALLARLRKGPPGDGAEALEAAGLLGRAWKQIYFDATDRAGAGAQHALAQAIEAYRRPYEADPKKNTWHGVNLLALLSRSRREGLMLAPELDPGDLALDLVTTLRAVPPAERDGWYQPTLAEVTLGLSLGTGDLRKVEQQLRDYVGAPGVQAFQVASTLRQFSEVWGLDDLVAGSPGTHLGSTADCQRARNLTDILRARLLQLPGGAMALPVARWLRPAATGGELQGVVQGVQASTPARSATDGGPDRSQLEAVLGAEGPKTFAWWRAGVDTARSVAAIRAGVDRRIGTGFLVRAGQFGLTPADELLVLTNFHVVNEHGAAPGIPPGVAEVVFEAVDAGRAYGVAEIVWSSPPNLHDASLLRLTEPVQGVPPLRLSTDLPQRPTPLDAKAAAPRVYVIGHPGGRELSISFQDNELIDHEGEPDGKPQIPGVCRVHYRAPTEGGNSGSPVFNATGWQVIALHHKGGKLGMPRLNGQAGNYAANEGLAMKTLLDAARFELVGKATPSAT